MKAFTLKSEIVSVDKSTAAISKITKSYDKMAKTITRETKVANATFTSFAKNVGIRAKKLQIGLNNVNASINRTFRKIGSSKLALGFGVGVLAIIGSVIQANIQLDASIASLQAITGVTGDAFSEFRTQIDDVSKSQKLFAGDTAKAFEIVGSAQPVLLKNAEALASVTDAAITLKKAGLMPIEESAKAVTGTMNQFGLEAEHAQRVINVLAAGAKEGSANIVLLSESMDKVGAVADAANMSVEKTAAAVELMSKFNLKGSEAGISLKSTLLRLKSSALGFASGQFNLNDALEEYNQNVNAISDPIKKAAYEEKVFGKIHILTGKILTENIGELDRLTEAMTGTNEATIQANINNNTFKNRLAEISAAWKNNVTATENQGKQMNWLKDLMAKVADNMERIISFAIKAIKAFLIFKAVIIANSIAIGAYNIALGVMGALSGKAAIAIGSNTVAIAAYNVTTKIATISTKIFSKALIAIPVLAVLTAITFLITKYIKLQNKTKELTEDQRRFNDQLANTSELMNEISKTEISFKNLDLLNKRQQENLKLQLKSQLLRLENLQSETNIAIRNNEEYKKLLRIKKEIRKQESEGGLKDFTLPSQLRQQEEEVLKEYKRISGGIGIGDLDKKINATKGKISLLEIAIGNNTQSLDDNTSAVKNSQWKGRFTTTILKDANITERTVGIAQREIATTAIANERSIANTQDEVIREGAPQSVTTQNSAPVRREKTKNGQITINVVDQTGGKFGIEVESTGIEVITTGNA